MWYIDIEFIFLENMFTLYWDSKDGLCIEKYKRYNIFAIGVNFDCGFQK